MTGAVLVVVAWRGRPGLVEELDALRATAPADVLLVVNEAGSVPVPVGDARPWLEVLPLPDNRGYAGGANAGLGRAFARGARHALLLNDDVRLEPGALDALLAAAGEDGCAAPTIEAPGDDRFAGGALDTRRGFGYHRDGALDYLTGAALCISRSAWDRVGPLDERLFLYYEDVEWCARARRAGVPLRLAPARARHAAGTTSGRGATWAYYDMRNRLWLLRALSGGRAAWRESFWSLRDIGAYARHGGSRAVTVAKLRGLRDFAIGRMGRGPYPRSDAVG